MKKAVSSVLAIFIITLCPGHLLAQYTFFNPEDGFAIEVSLPNTPLKRLPMYRNAISSLLVVDDFIIGGTSADQGLAPFVFVASLTERQLTTIKDLDEVIPGQQRIESGYCRGKNNVLFAGTIANKNNDGTLGDGHLMQMTIGQQGTIDMVDLGVPIPGEGVLSLLCNAQGTVLYGLSYPTGQFFSYTLSTKQVHTYNDIVPTQDDLATLSEYALDPENYLCKALIQDDRGLIYGSLPINQLFSFNPNDECFTVLNDHLPEVWGRRTLGQVESWAKAKDGTLYGGNTGDGQLFMLDPTTHEVKNLGKPIMMKRLRGLTFGKDGKLYGREATPGMLTCLVMIRKERAIRIWETLNLKWSHRALNRVFYGEDFN